MTRIPVQVSSLQNHGSSFPSPAVIAAGQSQALRNSCRGAHGWARAAAPRRLVKGSWTLALAALLLTATGAQAQYNFVTGDQSISVTAPSGGTVSSVEVLTLGVPGTTNPLLDFQAVTGAFTCVSSIALAGNGTCNQSVTFNPTAPGLRIGAVVLLDSGGAVLGTTLISGTGSGGLGVLTPGNLLPVAGDGLYLGAINDGKAATLAELYWPTSQVVDGAGNLYIADSLHNRLRMVCAGSTSATVTIKGTGSGCTAKGIIVTIAGNGNATDTGDNGLASAATLNDPSGLAIDGAGNLYIADTGNGVVRMISAATGNIATVAGSNPAAVCGAASNTIGDGCLATAATLSSPQGVTLDGAGNLYIADTNDHRIRLVSVSTGNISTIAGNGTTDPSTGAGGYSGDKGNASAAELNYPYTVAFDPSGNMYIPDSGNHVVREVAATAGVVTGNSTITTFAGTGIQGYTGNGAAANKAELDSPLGVAIDAAGNVYIADAGNNAIRKVNGATQVITTLLVNKTGTDYFNGTFAVNALFGPSGLYLDGAGNLYVADSANMIVRELQGNIVALDFRTPSVRQYSQSTVKDQTVENDGNAPLDVTAITHDTNALNDTSITDSCGLGDLAVNADCVIGAVFWPQVAANPLVANIYVAGNTQDGPPAVTAPNSPLDIQLVGDATAVNSTTVTVTGTPATVGYGQAVTLTASVQTGSGTGKLTGTITFSYNGTNVIQSGVAVGATTTVGTDSTATATFVTSTPLPVGIDEITATYVVTNDPTHLGSTSPQSPETILEDTKTTLTTSGSPSAVGNTVTFTATVSIFGGGGVTPDGTVTLNDGGNQIGSQTLTSSGVVTFPISTLTPGVHTITAQYSGGIANPQVKPSQSTVSQDVQAASTVAVTSSLPTSNYGQPVTFTATVTPNGTAPATGTVNFLDNGVIIGSGTIGSTPNQATLAYSALPVGSDSITADYLGDTNNGPSNSLAITQTVNKTQTSTTVIAAPSPGIAGAPEAITATVKVVAGAATTSGLVTFTSGTTTLGSANLNTTTGTATINPVLTPGTYSIVATYAGDSNDDGSASTPALALTVNQATTQTAVTATPNPALVQATVTFTAKVTGAVAIPTGTVTFSANGTQIGTPATLDGTGTAALAYSGLAAGTYSITAVYSGDTDNQGDTGTDATQLVIGKIATTTDLGTSTTSGTTPQVILVAAVLPGSAPVPTGTITFNNGPTVVGSAQLDSSGLATLVPNLPLGTYTIVAVYSGDLLHSPSTSLPITISGTASGFNLAVTPATLSIATKQNATVTVTLSSIDGFTDTIGLGCASLPAGVTCHFSTISAALAANGTATAKLTIDTNNPLSGGSAMNSHAGNQRTYLAGLFLPFSLFFGGLFWRFRKRHAAALTIVLLLVLSGAAMLVTGCGGFTSSSATPGTYVIQVTGTGINSNVIHYQNVTLTIK